MLKVYFFIFCFLIGLGLHAQDRIELGVQTTRRGVVWHRPGLPTHAPQWRPSRDTNAVFWVDTLTSLRYHWDYLRDVWRTYGTTKTALPPPAQQISGAAKIDNTTALWIRDTFNLLHKYDSTCSAWTPMGEFFVSVSVPTDISLSPTNGAAIYTRSLWQRSTDYEVHYWDGAVWQPFDSGGTDTSGYNLAFSLSNDTIYLTDGNGTLFVQLPPPTTDPLPYYLNDGDAIADGWPVGETYLLAPGNTLAMPTGTWKTVVGCGFECASPIRFFASDAAATAVGIPPGQQYATSATNIYGILYGFVRAVYADLDSDTLECASVLPEYIDDPDAIADGAVLGDHYTVTAENPYGAPSGCERVVSISSTTDGLAPDCCNADATLAYYDDDAAAIAGGLASDNYYLLSAANPYGWPRSTKKRIQ
jgi:hypothetical protein